MYLHNLDINSLPKIQESGEHIWKALKIYFPDLLSKDFRGFPECYNSLDPAEVRGVC